MRLYNTLTKQKENFIPLDENEIKMYVCGPTVYDYMHIGNARPYVVFDMIRRYLEFKGYNVKYIQNFTDVDDKIIKKALEQNVSMQELTEKYISAALDDAKSLNVLDASHNPRVTHVIPDIIAMIQNLISKGYAYQKNNNVYFNTSLFKNYGCLSKKNIDELISGLRINEDEKKLNKADFILWKEKKDDEPSWQSPWGEGRPGWHIECSVMAKKFLGDTIDIHAGGQDLIFPHHENEIAQSEAANNKKFAKYWLHNGFVNINSKKMSKSSGNFFTLKDILLKFSPEIIRFFILSTHYRSPINFSEELLTYTKTSFDRIQNTIFNIIFLIKNDIKNNNLMSFEEQELIPHLDCFKTKFINSMDDDFNSSDAISYIFEIVKFANINIKNNSSLLFKQTVLNYLLNLSNILGVNFSVNYPKADDNSIEDLIQERNIAREKKDFALADQIRQKLFDMNIEIKDTSLGTKWSYIQK